MDVLVLCTGNQHRSPVVAALLRRRLDDLGVEITVSSAGTQAGERRVSDLGVQVLAEHGFDLSDHVSRPVVATMVAEADLVLGLEHAHVREALTLVPDALPKCFTLGELVHRGELVGARQPNQTLGEWLGELAAERSGGPSTAGHDVADIGRESRRRYRALVAELDGLVTRLVDLAFRAPSPAAEPSDAHPAPPWASGDDAASPVASAATPHGRHGDALRATDDVRSRAEEEARAIVARAQAEAATILADAEAEAARLRARGVAVLRAGMRRAGQHLAESVEGRATTLRASSSSSGVHGAAGTGGRLVRPVRVEPGEPQREEGSPSALRGSARSQARVH